MRFLLFSSLFLLFSVVNSYSADVVNASLAIVDVKMIFRSHPNTDEIKVRLEDEKSKSYEKVKEKEREILSIEKELESKSESLSENDFRQYLGNIESKKESLRKFILEENKRLRLYEKSLKKPLLREIFAVIDKLRVQRGYLIVMHKEDVVSFDSSIDLTYDVISMLKKGS